MENFENEQFNLPSMSISTAVDILSSMLIKAVETNFCISKLQSTMLWGPPGVGKSEGVRVVAKRIEEKTGKKVNVQDVRLLMFNPIDLRGIPVANQDKTEAIWLKPDIFKLDDSDDVINIIFLDELTAAPQSVQACAYQITLDRKIGEHHLPENTYVVCAGNRKCDGSVSNQMPKALCNRMMHFDVVSDFVEWKKWALNNNINEKIIGFLQYKSEFLNKGVENKNEIAFASPRTWEMASNMINYFSDNIENEYLMISGLVGNGIASEFISFCKCYELLPNVDDIFDGKDVDIPKEADVLYSLISAMTTKTKECVLNGKPYDNAIEYAKRFPADFSYVYYLNLIDIGKMYDTNLLINEKVEEWGEQLTEKICV